MNDVAIQIEGLHKSYKGRKKSSEKTALNAVDLTIPKGSFFGLLGPNGAGKSTLINILSGVTVKSAGKVWINGVDQDEDAPKSRMQLGVVPQEVVLDPFFPVTEMLEYYAGYFGVPKSQRRTEEIIKAMALEDKAHVNARKLSGGMKRRVLIAKALVHNPPILILDEPTAGVDVELRTQLWDYVRKLNEQGTTILLTTHYLEEAEELCDHIAIINHGEIIANDNTKNLLKQLDSKQAIFQFEKPIKKALGDFAGCHLERLDDKTLSVQYCAERTDFEGLLAHMRKLGGEILDISTKEPDLEDTFRYLIQQQSERKEAV